MTDNNFSIRNHLLFLFLCQGIKYLLTNCKKNMVTADFVCVDVLRPSQPNRVMSSAVSLPNHTFTGQALTSSKQLTSIAMCTFFGQKLTTALLESAERREYDKIFDQSPQKTVASKVWCQLLLNPQPPDQQTDSHSTEPPRHVNCWKFYPGCEALKLYYE